MDRALNSSSSRASLVLVNPEGRHIQYALQLNVSSTNNEVKYKDLIASLTIAKEFGVQHLKSCNDL